MTDYKIKHEDFPNYNKLFFYNARNISQKCCVQELYIFLLNVIQVLTQDDTARIGESGTMGHGCMSGEDTATAPNMRTVFSLIIAQVSNSSAVSNSSTVFRVCEKIDVQFPIGACASIRLSPYVLVRVSNEVHMSWCVQGA